MSLNLRPRTHPRNLVIYSLKLRGIFLNFVGSCGHLYDSKIRNSSRTCKLERAKVSGVRYNYTV